MRGIMAALDRDLFGCVAFRYNGFPQPSGPNQFRRRNICVEYSNFLNSINGKPPSNPLVEHKVDLTVVESHFEDKSAFYAQPTAIVVSRGRA